MFRSSAALLPSHKDRHNPSRHHLDERIHKTWGIECSSPLQEKGILKHATTWMNLEGFMLRIISQLQKDKYYVILLNMRNHGVIKLTEREKQNKGEPLLEIGWNGNYWLVGTEVQCGIMKKFCEWTLVLVGGTTLWMHLMPPDCELRSSWNGKCCIVYI